MEGKGKDELHPTLFFGPGKKTTTISQARSVTFNNKLKLQNAT